MILNEKCGRCGRPLTLGHRCLGRIGQSASQYLAGRDVNWDALDDGAHYFETWIEFLGHNPIQHIGQAFRYNFFAGLGTLTWDILLISTGIALFAGMMGLLPATLFSPVRPRRLAQVHVTGGWKAAMAVSACCFVGILAAVAYFSGLYATVLSRI